MDGQRFTKIKYDPKKERVVLNYTIENGTDEPDEFSVNIRQPPHPDLVDALAALGEHALALCELEGVEAEDLEVRSVSFSWSHDVMGATITALRTLRRSSSPLVLNTPHKTVAHYGEDGDDEHLLPESTVEALMDLVHEARAFLPPPIGRAKRGEKPQTEMDLEGEQDGLRVTITAGGRSVETDLAGIKRAADRAGDLTPV